MNERNFGYVRVSSKEQNEERQLLAMERAEIPAQRLFIDKSSGKDFERPAYRKMLRRLKEGDTVFLLSVDRLGRNYTEIQEQWRILTKEKRVDIVVLDMPLLDTRREKDLLGTFIADLGLQILSFIAQNERENIRARQAAGIEAAKLRGVRFGRPAKCVPKKYKEIFSLWARGFISATEGAKLCDFMSTSSFRYTGRNYVFRSMLPSFERMKKKQERERKSEERELEAKAREEEIKEASEETLKEVLKKTLKKTAKKTSEKV